MIVPLAPGRTVERYRVEELLGEGGTAVVWRVRHVHLGTDHALKVMTLLGAQAGPRLLLEGRVQAGLRHPNIVAVTDVLEIDGSYGLLMEYVPPPSLGAWVQKHGAPPVEVAEALFRGIVEGVRHAHGHGLVHRDLKPANVLLARGDAARGEDALVPKVADFGLARLLDEDGHRHTRSGLAMGTPQYMAPEQFRDAKSVDRRADLFSLGCILHELLSGAPAFAWTDMIAVYDAMLGQRWAPLPAGTPDHLRNAVAGCLAPDRDARIPDCGTLVAVLDGGARGPTLVPPAIGRAGAGVLPPGPPLGRAPPDAPTLVAGADAGETITFAPDPLADATLDSTPPRARPDADPRVIPAEPGVTAGTRGPVAPGVPTAAETLVQSASPPDRPRPARALFLAAGVAVGAALLGGWWAVSGSEAPDPAAGADAPVAATSAESAAAAIEPAAGLDAAAGTDAPGADPPPTIASALPSSAAGPAAPREAAAPASPASAPRGAGTTAGLSPASSAPSPGSSAPSSGASAPSSGSPARVPTAASAEAPASASAEPPSASSSSPASAPSASAPPASAHARATASGADTVWLVGPDGRQVLPATVTPGRYKIWADFGAGPVDAGEATLSAGDDLSVVCNASFTTCRVRR